MKTYWIATLSAVFFSCASTPPVITPPAPPPPPPIPVAANISGTYSGTIEVLTCYPGQVASMTLTLSKDPTDSAKYVGSLKTAVTTVSVAAFNDGLEIEKFTIYSTPGQNGFVQFKVVRSSNGVLSGTFSQLVSVGTCSDSALSGEATGTVIFAP